MGGAEGTGALSGPGDKHGTLNAEPQICPSSVLSVSLRQARGSSADTRLRPIVPHWALAWRARRALTNCVL